MSAQMLKKSAQMHLSSDSMRQHINNEALKVYSIVRCGHLAVFIYFEELRCFRIS